MYNSSIVSITKQRAGATNSINTHTRAQAEEKESGILQSQKASKSAQLRRRPRTRALRSVFRISKCDKEKSDKTA